MSTNTQKDFNVFKEALGISESSGNYKTIQPKTGCFGKYQFSKSRLLDFGITDIQTFLNSPELQENVFRKHTTDIINYVIKNLLSSLVAGAHLAGKGGLKNYILSGTNTRDALGTSLLAYNQKFQNYDLSELIFEDKNKEIADYKIKIMGLEQKIANSNKEKQRLREITNSFGKLASQAFKLLKEKFVK